MDEKFDSIVSVGMFEHVGVRHYPEFFGQVKELLHEDGVALLHSIGHTGPPSFANAWLRKYIFPGGYSPALSEVFDVVERSGLWVNDLEILRLHYAETLREWNRRFPESRTASLPPGTSRRPLASRFVQTSELGRWLRTRSASSAPAPSAEAAEERLLSELPEGDRRTFFEVFFDASNQMNVLIH